ncbi:GDSL-type esterase/lipase family protein [Myxococcus dinghuensis]|uniref:GDSL-type esterase/lipase family protein n=1 Tax=Myxococcus dinghuensis TaxID=2906761 RepID=UPI003899301D
MVPALACGLLVACEIGAEPRPLPRAPAPPAPAPVAAPVSPRASPPSAPTLRPRVMPAPPERTRSIQELAQKLGATGTAVDDPCLESGASGCARTALTPWFESLDALSSGLATGPSVIEAFGNSLIAGDRIVDILRDDLGAAFGVSGRGVLLVDRMAPYGGRGRTGLSKGGWQPRTLGELRAPPHPFGITGVYHVATEARARSRFKLEGETRGTLWWLDVPKAGGFSVVSGDQVLARTEPTGSGGARATHFTLPEGASTVDIVAEGKGAVAQGVVLQHGRPGVILDMLGVPSADATLYARLDDAALRSQLAERDPRLLLFFLGGNESKRLEWKRTDIDTLRTDLRALLRRARAAAPASACMVVGPMDAVRDTKADGKKPFTQRPFLEAVVEAEREVTMAEGCAFFNLYAAMGGKGALTRFHQAGFMHEDLVHPRGRGLDVLGHLVTDALLRAWVAAPQGRRVAALTPAQTAPAAASERTVEAAP